MNLAQHTFDELRQLVHELCGLVIPDEKVYLIQHRLGPLARQGGCRTFEEFAHKLRGPDGPTWHEPIIEAITTSETSFFRDGHPFETFRQHLLPQIVEAARRRATSPFALKERGEDGELPINQVRIWSVAAATGQEPYSLAMLIHDYIEANRRSGASERDFSILATDISAKVLATAQAAEYSKRELNRGLTTDRIVRHFVKRDEKWAVCEPVRQLVEFRRINLVKPVTGLGLFDAVVCRNVLIYFDDDTRRRIARQLFDSMHDGAWLILGSAENLFGFSDGFETSRFGDTAVYRKAEQQKA
jgi:chemotaxis protein methyltransferase CheR